MVEPYPVNVDCSRLDGTDDGKCHVAQIDDCVVVTVGGRIDADQLPAVLDAIDVAGVFARRIVIDLTRVTFLAPAALEAVNGALACACESDDWVSLIGPAGVVHRTLKGATSDGDFSVRDHMDDTEVALDRTADMPRAGRGRPASSPSFSSV
jgi:anti-anti-sigma regulatory factor